MNRVVEVLPDVSGIDRTLCLRGPRRARRERRGRLHRPGASSTDGASGAGWSPRRPARRRDRAAPGGRARVARAAAGGRRARRWAAWRYAGRLRPLLVGASPPRLVRGAACRRAARPGTSSAGPPASRARSTLEARDRRAPPPKRSRRSVGGAAPSAGGAEACRRRRRPSTQLPAARATCSCSAASRDDAVDPRQAPRALRPCASPSSPRPGRRPPSGGRDRRRHPLGGARPASRA